MDVDKYGCFMQYMFFISETRVKIEHEEYTCFKDHRCFSKNLFMSSRNEKNKINTRFPSLLFLCTEKVTDTNLFTFSHDRAAVYLLYIITFICLSVPHAVF